MYLWLQTQKTYLYQRRIRISQCLRMWIEVDRVVVSDQSVIPTRLDVRNLERVADRLDVARRDAALRTEKTRDASLQWLADLKHEKMKSQIVFLVRKLIIIPFNANIKVFILFFFIGDHFKMSLSGCSYFSWICNVCLFILPCSVLKLDSYSVLKANSSWSK